MVSSTMQFIASARAIAWAAAEVTTDARAAVNLLCLNYLSNEVLLRALRGGEGWAYADVHAADAASGAPQVIACELMALAIACLQDGDLDGAAEISRDAMRALRDAEARIERSAE